MRGVPVRWLGHLHGSRHAWRDGDSLAVVLARAAAGYGGDRRWPVEAATCVYRYDFPLPRAWRAYSGAYRFVE